MNARVLCNSRQLIYKMVQDSPDMFLSEEEATSSSAKEAKTSEDRTRDELVSE